MANITLSGTLLDPNSGFAARDKIRFTHKTTTGSTLKGSVSTLVIGADGAYSIDLQYGLVLVERRDSTKSQYINLGVVTVNADNPATTLPELLSATVPVSSEELIEFQSILADCVAAQEAAEAAAAEVAQLENNTGASLVGTSSGATVQESLDALTAGQTGGVIVFATYALLDAYTPQNATEEKSSFKVTNDSNSALNGYYSWVSGTTYTKDANLSVDYADPIGTDSVTSRGVYISQSPFIPTANIPTGYEAIKAIRVYGPVQTNRNYGVTVFKKNVVSGLDLLTDIAIYTYALGSSTPVTNVARFTQLNYVPSASREWIKVPSIVDSLGIALDMFIDWDDIPDGTSNSNVPIDNSAIRADCFESLGQDIGERFILSNNTSNGTSVSIKDFIITMSGLLLKDKYTDKYVYLNAPGDTTQGGKLVETTLQMYPLNGNQVKPSVTSTLYFYITAEAFNATTKGGNLEIQVGDNQFFNDSMHGIYLLGTINERYNTASWRGPFFDSITQVGWNDPTYDVDDKFKVDFAVSNSLGLGGVQLTGNTLSFGVVFCSQPDSSKIVYLSLEDGVNGQAAVSQLDLSTLSNTSYLYIERADFESASTNGTINVKTQSSWFSNDTADRFILGIVQTVGSKFTWTGPIFDIIPTVGWNDPDYSPSAQFVLENINTDAMATFNYKAASIENGNNESLVIGLHGDSWTHKTDIFSRYTTYVARALRSKYGNGGGGWYDFAASSGDNFMYSIDEDDANDTRSGTIAYSDQISSSRGINIAHATFSNGAELNLDITTAHTKLVIHYQGGNGSFTYSLDGGSAIAVNAAIETGYRTIELNVSDAVHTLDFIATSDNTIIYGVDMQRQYGCRVHKFGNRGLQSTDVIDSISYFKEALANFELDSMTSLLGTNEKTSSMTPSLFKSNMSSIYDAVIEVHPFIDFGLIAASNTEQSGLTYSATEYAKQLYNIAYENDLPFISTIPLFGTREKIINKGFFFDSVHPTIIGGKSICDLITRTVFK